MIKGSKCIKMNSNTLYLIINKVNGYFEEKLVPSNESKENF